MSTQLNFAIENYGHTKALIDGSISIEGVKANFIEVKPIISAFRRMVRNLEFDICEMAPATYMIAREHGAKFTALPIFVFRRFHHNGLVIRPDSNINTPLDLHGKSVGVRAYSVTTGIWTRGILQDEYGVDSSKIQWIVDDQEHVADLILPPNVQTVPHGTSIASLMASGEISAAFTANAGIGRSGQPTQNWTSNRVRDTEYSELIPNFTDCEKDWYRKTGIYPIHGLIVVKHSVLKNNPSVGNFLFNAFEHAKNRYLEKLNSGFSICDKDAHYRDMSKIVGDPLPYGLEPNRPAIETLIRYCHQQGLLKKRYLAEEMFFDTTK